MRTGIIAFSSILLLMLIPLAGAFQQEVGQIILEPPYKATGSYTVSTGDEAEARMMSIVLEEHLRPYIAIDPAEPFEMQPRTAREIHLTTNYTGGEEVTGMISVTASPLGVGSGGAVISVRLNKGVLLKAYNETAPFVPPEIVEPPEVPEEEPNITPSVPPTGVPSAEEPVFETYVVVDPLVWTAAIFILAGIVIYAYLYIQKRQR